MKSSEMLSVVMTYISLTLFYVLVMTPPALLVRFLGKDLLHLEFNSREQSCWMPVDPDGSDTQSRKRY